MNEFFVSPAITGTLNYRRFVLSTSLWALQMRLTDLFSSRRFVLSIEMFPPKTADSGEALKRSLLSLNRFNPAFLSCTYGAGGSTRGQTLDWCQWIQQTLQRPSMAHFTCVSSTVDELTDWLHQAWQSGVRNIMSLRGDPPVGQQVFTAAEGGLSHASELTALIRRLYPEMGIGVAGYPEKHVEAPSMDADLQHLKTKVDAGADAIFTQLFFINRSFFEFRDQCAARGITVPIVPGIMPITDFARIRRITAMCGSLIPIDLATRLEAVREDAAAQFEIGVEHAIRQCQQLQAEGVPGIHFYALNKSDACERILNALNLNSA